MICFFLSPPPHLLGHGWRGMLQMFVVWHRFRKWDALFRGERIHWFLSHLHNVLISDCCQKGAWNWFYVNRNRMLERNQWTKSMDIEDFESWKSNMYTIEWRMNDFFSFCLCLKFFPTVWSLMYQPSTAYFHLQQKLNWKWKFFDVIYNTERNLWAEVCSQIGQNWSVAQYWNPSWQDFNRSIFNSSVQWQCDPN